MKRVSIVFLIFLHACNAETKHNYQEQFGINFNRERKKMNIPLLNSEWKLHDTQRINDSVFFLSFSPEKISDSLTPVSKIIKIVNGGLYRDESNYLGKKKYQTADGTFFEELYISIERKNVSDSFIWGCEFKSINPEYRISVTKEQADSILKSWNIYPY